jgi:hypothetical protein
MGIESNKGLGTSNIRRQQFPLAELRKGPNRPQTGLAVGASCLFDSRFPSQCGSAQHRLCLPSRKATEGYGRLRKEFLGHRTCHFDPQTPGSETETKAVRTETRRLQLFVVHPLGCARSGVPTGLKSTLKGGHQTHQPERHAKIAKAGKENFNAETPRNAEVRREDLGKETVLAWIRLNRGNEPHAKVANAAKEQPKFGVPGHSSQFLCGLRALCVRPRAVACRRLCESLRLCVLAVCRAHGVAGEKERAGDKRRGRKGRRGSQKRAAFPEGIWDVAQTCSLLYRRLAVCQAHDVRCAFATLHACDRSPALQTTSLRYGRLQVCATSLSRCHAEGDPWASDNSNGSGPSRALQTTSLRYSRLQVCATPLNRTQFCGAPFHSYPMHLWFLLHCRRRREEALTSSSNVPTRFRVTVQRSRPDQSLPRNGFQNLTAPRKAAEDSRTPRRWRALTWTHGFRGTSRRSARLRASVLECGCPLPLCLATISRFLGALSATFFRRCSDTPHSSPTMTGSDGSPVFGPIFSVSPHFLFVNPTRFWFNLNV